MKCVICRLGETRPSTATVTLDRSDTTLVIKNVPAEACENCGEEYIREDVTMRLLASANDAAAAGVQVDVRTYRAA